jgi:hypothetical protein
MAASRSYPGRVVAIAVVIAAALSGTMLLLLGVPLVFLVLFSVAFFNGRTRQSALRDARLRPICLPDVTSFCDGRARGLIQRLSRSRVDIRSAVRAGPHGAAFDLRDPLEAIPQLERVVVILASRIEYLARFVQSVAATSPTDGRARAPVNMKHLGERAEILAGTAEEILTALEETPARIIGLQLRRLEACDAGSHKATDASDLMARFDALEQAAVEGVEREA